MAQSRRTLFGLAFYYIVGIVYSQQLQNVYSEPSWPNITTKCFEAMNTTVSCPAFLQRVSVEYVLSCFILRIYLVNGK
jgi:hypothetical protein